jgi:membrane fusion protein (multidrug efflux system)
VRAATARRRLPALARRARRRTPWLLGLLACIACGDAAEEPRQAPPVTLSPVRAVDLRERIEATGELVAKEQAPIAAEVGGRVSEVLVDEGTRVEAGTPVLAIDPERRRLERDSAKARTDEALAALREQERELRRVGDLRERKVASQTQLEQAQTARKLSQARHLAAAAELGVAERALRDATVAAPFAGYVAQRYVGRGEYVQPGTPLFELVSLDPIEVEFSVTEVDSGRVAAGQEVGVRLAPFPDETFGATVTFVSPTIDPRTRTLRVKAQLDNREGRLRPGLFARVDLGVSERAGVPMVPEEAILQRSDGAVVFRTNGDHRVERVVIETGVHREGWVEVVHGLAPGDLVVSRGQAVLKDGDLVTPREVDGTLAGAPPAPDAASERP